MLKKLKTFFLIVAAVVCLANLGSCSKENDPSNQSTSIIIKKATSHGSSDKTGIPSEVPITGNQLLIEFTDPIGMVTVNISTKAGKTVQKFEVSTPTCIKTFVQKRGKYTITFTLDDGSEYWGKFTIR